MLDLEISKIDDKVIRDNFRRLQDAFRDNPFLNGDFRVFEVEYTAADPDARIKHNFSFVPRDCLLIFIEGDYNFFFLHDQFDKEFIHLKVGGPCKARFLAGRTTRQRGIG